MASFEERVRAAAHYNSLSGHGGDARHMETARGALYGADAAEPEIGAVRRWLAGEAVDEATLPRRLRETVQWLKDLEAKRVETHAALTSIEVDLDSYSPTLADTSAPTPKQIALTCTEVLRVLAAERDAARERLAAERDENEELMDALGQIANLFGHEEVEDAGTLDDLVGEVREALSERDECSPRIAAHDATDERVAELVTAFDAERSERRAVERQRDEARAEVERLKTAMGHVAAHLGIGAGWAADDVVAAAHDATDECDVLAAKVREYERCVGDCGRPCGLLPDHRFDCDCAESDCLDVRDAHYAAESARALADAAAKGEPPERVPTPEEAEVLRAVDDGEPWAMKSPEAGECAKAGWIGNGHDGPGLTPSGCAALARFEAQEAAREKAAKFPQHCEYCDHVPGCGPRDGCDCAVCCHDPTPDDGGDVIDWRARALAAEAEVAKLRAALDDARSVAALLADMAPKTTDHGCHECVPGGPLARGDFVCNRHKALAWHDHARRAEANGGSDADA